MVFFVLITCLFNNVSKNVMLINHVALFVSDITNYPRDNREIDTFLRLRFFRFFMLNLDVMMWKITLYFLNLQQIVQIYRK